MMVRDKYCNHLDYCLLQASLQGPSVQMTITQQSVSVAQSVSPGHLVEAPGMGPAPSTASTPCLWHTWSLVTTLRGGSCVGQASCVNKESVLEIINTSGRK